MSVDLMLPAAAKGRPDVADDKIRINSSNLD